MKGDGKAKCGICQYVRSMISPMEHDSKRPVAVHGVCRVSAAFHSPVALEQVEMLAPPGRAAWRHRFLYTPVYVERAGWLCG